MQQIDESTKNMIMKTTTLLHCFEFAIMPAASLVSLHGNENHPVATHLPLMRVNIDFEKSRLLLDGEWQFLVAANVRARSKWFSYHEARVTVDLSLFHATVIDLSDPFNDGIVIVADGIINDGSSINSCSGMVILDKSAHPQKPGYHNWDITFYLYDYQEDKCEIKFRLPLYLNTVNEINN